MQGTLVRPLEGQRTALLIVGVPAAALLVVWNFAGVLHTVSMLPNAGRISDWFYWGWVDPMDPYAWEWVRWSPPAVWAMTVIQPWALPIVMAAHVAVLGFLRPWWVIGVVLLSWPFWEDFLAGGTVVFCFVAAWTALRGSRAGMVAFVILAALIPRPIMLPVLAYLLWTRPESRWWFAGAAAFVAAYSLAVGQLDDWVLRMIEVGAEQQFNLSPSALIGPWWYPVGLALGVWLTVKGRLGLASLVVSPYLSMYYLLFGLLELQSNRLSAPYPAVSSPSRP